MHIKLECYCGMKYEFNVEPVDGRMPYEISCPNCDGDGTEYANQCIAQTLGQPPSTPPSEPEPDFSDARRPDVAMFVQPIDDDEPEPFDVAPVQVAPADSAPVESSPAGKSPLKLGFKPKEEAEAAAAAPAQIAPADPTPVETPPAGKSPLKLGFKPKEETEPAAAPTATSPAVGETENLAAANAEARRKRMAAIKAKQEAEQQQWKKIGRLGALAAVVVLGIVATLGWYVFSGSKPRLYYTVDAQELKRLSSAKLLEPDRLLLLDDSGLTLHNLKSGEIIWQTPVDDGDNGEGYSRLEIIGGNAWVFRDNAISRINLSSGKKDASVKINGAISQVTSSDKSILVAAESSRRGYQSLTRIDLATAKTEKEEVKVEETRSVSVGQVGGAENFEPSLANLTSRELRIGDMRLDRNWDKFVPTGENLAHLSVVLTVPKVTTVRAMRPVGESALTQNAKAAMDPTALVDEIVNDLNRAYGGGTKEVNESTYEATLRRRFAKQAGIWKGTLQGEIRFFAGKGVDVLTDMGHLYIFDKQNKLLKRDELSYPVHPDFFSGSEEIPFLEHDSRLYFFDHGTLTAYDLPSGKAAWKLPSVEISNIQIDDDGDLFVNSTTAPAESIQYSEQDYINNRPKAVLIKVDAKTGKKLWETEKAGQKSWLAGEYLYATQVSSSTLGALTGSTPADRFKLLRIDPGDGDRVWEKTIERGHAIDFNGTRILVKAGGNYRVFKYLTIF